MGGPGDDAVPRTPAVGVSRRGVLRAAGVGVLTMAVAGAGGLSYRAYDSNLLDSAHGHRLPQYRSGGTVVPSNRGRSALSTTAGSRKSGRRHPPTR